MVSRTVYLDAGKLREKEVAHDYLAGMLSLPSYYGKNLDALYDCLTELNSCRIVLMHMEEAEVKGSYGEKIIRVLEEGALDNPGVELEKL